jgi:hypothetical protein
VSYSDRVAWKKPDEGIGFLGAGFYLHTLLTQSFFHTRRRFLLGLVSPAEQDEKGTPVYRMWI